MLEPNPVKDNQQLDANSEANTTHLKGVSAPVLLSGYGVRAYGGYSTTFGLLIMGPDGRIEVSKTTTNTDGSEAVFSDLGAWKIVPATGHVRVDRIDNSGNQHYAQIYLQAHKLLI